ncbi:MAG: hypothetical protein AAF800_05250 [Planctomycetota bacterium]
MPDPTGLPDNDGLDASRPAWPALARVALWGLVAIGWGLLAWNASRPITLYTDDASLLLNILELSPAEYAGPLMHYQIAPWGFMVSVWAAVWVLGLDEWTVRLVPFLAAAGALPLVAWLVRRTCVPWAGLLALGGFVASGEWLLQACRVKPYTADVLFTALFLVLAVRLADRRCTWGRAAVLGAVGAAGMWFSVAFGIVVVAVGLTLLGLRAFGPARRDWGPLLTAGLAAAVSGAVHFLLVLRPQRQTGDTAEYMSAFWQSGFLPLPLPHPSRFAVRLMLFASDATQLLLPGLVLALILLGIGVWVLRRDRAGLLVVAPIVLAAALAMLKLYPISGRLALFLAPSMFLALAQGLTTLHRAIGNSVGRWAGVAAAAAAVFLMFAKPFDTRGRAPFEDDLMPVLEAVNERFRPDQRVYLYYGSQTVYDFYTRHHTPELAFPEDRLVRGQIHREQWLGYEDEVLALAEEPGEVWLVFTHTGGNHRLREGDYFDLLLERHGEPLERVEALDSFAVRWRPDRDPAPPAEDDRSSAPDAPQSAGESVTVPLPITEPSGEERRSP